MRDYKCFGTSVGSSATDVIEYGLADTSTIGLSAKLLASGVTKDNVIERLKLELEIRAMGLGEVD